ncbi:uncharacterized protein F54H12.2-like [Hermetia illucens]|uniref:uncharacterized protein F54H12.2-like n=1 Tax=Hermetia illucens TaxID=343691 RepID=UPI0018CC4A4C|nr:uncharacterized protein F54H12.2-like [Hermetia illucens]
MDIIESGKPSDSNQGYSKRSKLLAHSNVVEFMGKVHEDILNQDKLLINGVDLPVIFSPEKLEFYLYCKDDVQPLLIKIIEATMYMNHVTVNPNILYAHESVLQRSNTIYLYKRVEVKVCTLPANTFSLSLDNVAIGPNLLVFGMVDNEAYTGKRSKNSYNFKHNNLTRFNLSVNGVQVPNQPLEFDFSNEPPIRTRGYLSLFKGTGIYYSDQDNFNNSCGNLLNQGTIRIRFKNTLKQSTTCVVYAEYENSIEIDKARNIFTSY